MDEAQVVVKFIDENGNAEWRTFSIDVGPDDTSATINNRLGELLEEYEQGQLDWTPLEHAMEPVVDSSGYIEFEIISWPEFA